jgi:two-component system CheB/CheR fusion protein
VGNHQWDIASLRRELEAAFSEGAEVADREVDHFFPGIGRRVMSLTARKIRGDDERGDLLLVAIEDITARRSLMSHMEEESRRKDEFLAMLAHELRNPLSPILHAIHLLQRGGKSESAAALYEMIERQTQVLRRLVDDLLDTARIGRGLLELRREPVDLVAIVRLAAQAIQPHVEDHRHALSLSLPDAPVRVDGDPVRLEQVVFNLLENALKYTPAGGRIALSLTRSAGEAVLSVSDTGIGLEPGMCEKIFDLFTQADTSLVRTTGGLGLGLTLVRRLLAQHGGSIEAHSAGLGKGSEFVARLPLLAEVPEALHEQGQGRESKVAGTRPRRVLIVDDNVDAAKSMEMIVRAWGHPVEIARDGPEALAIAERFQPEIALVDIGLPGMNGYELASRLRADLARSNVKLVAVTGYGRDSDRIAARAAGFDAHLTKPADIADLERLLANDYPNGGD